MLPSVFFFFRVCAIKSVRRSFEVKIFISFEQRFRINWIIED
ncbi:unnamed protein product [Larinioides sclopetarius]|uniref:Uncharacterized protein n=1 Tax=Larinioides sclopetarius TaxID=280406 RepID=A0AAV2BPD2_9ARAC